MFINSKAFSGFAVDDFVKVWEFYGGTFGLEVSEDNGLLMLELVGGRVMFVYLKLDFVLVMYMILNFLVEDIDVVVRELAQWGVVFECYEGFG